MPDRLNIVVGLKLSSDIERVSQSRVQSISEITRSLQPASAAASVVAHALQIDFARVAQVNVPNPALLNEKWNGGGRFKKTEIPRSLTGPQTANRYLAKSVSAANLRKSKNAEKDRRHSN